MRDGDIRPVLLDRLRILYGADPTTIIVEELGLHCGTVRADVAVINGCLKGYEIKSAKDTLERLNRQSDGYGKVFDTVTLVLGESHLEQAQQVVPNWWGIEVAHATGPSAGVFLTSFRTESANPGIDPLAVAQLLWREEVLAILSAGSPSGILSKKPRSYLWQALIDFLPLEQLKHVVRDALKSRTRWRVGGKQTLGDGTYQPSAMSSDCQFRPSRSRNRRYIHRPS